MSAFSAMDIAASGLSVQRTRMTLVASNLANIHSTRDPEVDGPYRRRELVVQAVPVDDFSDVLLDRLTGDGLTSSDIAAALRSVQVAGIDIDEAPPVERWDPNHPDADPETGIVQLPNISVMREMTDMMAAARLYEANLATLRTVRTMVEGALEIGRG